MRNSGRLKKESKAAEVAVVAKSCKLTVRQVQQLDAGYQDLLPDFAQLNKEYQHDKVRCKRMSTFPGRSGWSPPSRKLSAKECALRVGPGSHAQSLQRVTIQDRNTGRLVEYVPACRERSGSFVLSSYVKVDGEIPPCFGRIQSLFQHNFNNSDHIWATVKCFSDRMMKDDESGMWNVNPENGVDRLLHLSKLSYPLVIAYEADRLWFLNY